MIEQPFTMPVHENTALDMTQYKKMSLDEQIEFCIITLLNSANKDKVLYNFAYWHSSMIDDEYYISEEEDMDNMGQLPVVQMPLGLMKLIYERLKFNKSFSTPICDNYFTSDMTQLEMCEFLYSLTRKGAIDIILEKL